MAGFDSSSQLVVEGLQWPDWEGIAWECASVRTVWVVWERGRTVGSHFV